MKIIFAYVMGMIYIFAGITHLIFPGPFCKIIPKKLPYPKMLVYISGFAEILCGSGFLFDHIRTAAAWATIALLVAIFPANINMAMHPKHFDIAAWILYLRLPLQFILIWFAYLYT